MLASRVFDEDVAGLGREVVRVEARDEGISLAGSKELFVAEEGREGESTGRRRCCFRGGVGIHPRDDEFGLYTRETVRRVLCEELKMERTLESPDLEPKLGRF